MAFDPSGIDRPGSIVGIRTVEENYAMRVGAIGQNSKQIGLCSSRFGEDDRLLLRSQLVCLRKSDVQGLEQGLAFSIMPIEVASLANSLRSAISASIALRSVSVNG
jgi:hypothetical protein